MWWPIKVIGGEAIALGVAWLWQLASGSIRFNNVISIGSALTAALVVIAAGLFTIRTHVAKAWKENYFAEKERADNKELELKELHDKLDSEREIQRDLRHELKAEIATLKLKISELDRKTDLSIFRAEAAERFNTLNSVLVTLSEESLKQTQLMTEILQERRVENGTSVSPD